MQSKLKEGNNVLAECVTVALTHLDDPDNAKQAYEQAVVLEQ